MLNYCVIFLDRLNDLHKIANLKSKELLKGREINQSFDKTKSVPIPLFMNTIHFIRVTGATSVYLFR